MSVVFEDSSSSASGDEAPHVGLRWDGWETTARTSADTLDNIQLDILEKTGQALNLFLMTLGRETMY